MAETRRGSVAAAFGGGCGLAAVAVGAERLEVAVPVAAAVGDGDDVVDLGRWAGAYGAVRVRGEDG